MREAQRSGLEAAACTPGADVRVRDLTARARAWDGRRVPREDGARGCDAEGRTVAGASRRGTRALARHPFVQRLARSGSAACGPPACGALRCSSGPSWVIWRKLAEDVRARGLARALRARAPELVGRRRISDADLLELIRADPSFDASPTASRRLGRGLARADAARAFVAVSAAGLVESQVALSRAASVPDPLRQRGRGHATACARPTGVRCDHVP